MQNLSKIDKVIPYGRQNINEEDINAVINALKSDYLTQGPKILEFEKAFADHGYKGQYRGVYPIKVNQQRHLVQELVKHAGSYSLESRNNLRLHDCLCIWNRHQHIYTY